MLDILPKDILLFITKYMYSRDLINLKLSSRYFMKNIDYNGKFFDNTRDITYNTSLFRKIQLCGVCGHNLSKDDPKIEYCYRCDNIFEDKSIIVSKIYNINYTLFSPQDFDCLKDNCFCKSKQHLFVYNSNLPKSLIPSKKYGRHKYMYPQYIFETDYGKVQFDSRIYFKNDIIFTDIIKYTPTYNEIKLNFLPIILQTSRHHWIVLKYSNRTVPIKNIILKI